MGQLQQLQLRKVHSQPRRRRHELKQRRQQLHLIQRNDTLRQQAMLIPQRNPALKALLSGSGQLDHMRLGGGIHIETLRRKSRDLVMTIRRGGRGSERGHPSLTALGRNRSFALRAHICLHQGGVRSPHTQVHMLTPHSTAAQNLEAAEGDHQSQVIPREQPLALVVIPTQTTHTALADLIATNLQKQRDSQLCDQIRLYMRNESRMAHGIQGTASHQVPIMQHRAGSVIAAGTLVIQNHPGRAGPQKNSKSRMVLHLVPHPKKKRIERNISTLSVTSMRHQMKTPVHALVEGRAQHQILPGGAVRGPGAHLMSSPKTTVMMELRQMTRRQQMRGHLRREWQG